MKLTCAFHATLLLAIKNGKDNSSKRLELALQMPDAVRVKDISSSVWLTKDQWPSWAADNVGIIFHKHEWCYSVPTVSSQQCLIHPLQCFHYNVHEKTEKRCNCSKNKNEKCWSQMCQAEIGAPTKEGTLEVER